MRGYAYRIAALAMHLTLVNLLGVATIASTTSRAFKRSTSLFFGALLIVRTLPAFLYRPLLTWRECLASGLQSTNLSFIVVTVAVGEGLGRIREINATALVLAGLVSALVLPTVAAALLGEPNENVTARNARNAGSLLIADPVERAPRHRKLGGLIKPLHALIELGARPLRPLARHDSSRGSRCYGPRDDVRNPLSMGPCSLLVCTSDRQ